MAFLDTTFRGLLMGTFSLSLVAAVGCGGDPDADDDGDGLTNGEEEELGTDPADNDSDGDGVEDGDEVHAGTDPTDAADVPVTEDPDEFWVPYAFFIEDARFGYDPETDSAITYTVPDGAVDPSLVLRIVNEQALEATSIEEYDENSCFVIWSSATPIALSSWAADANVYFGFTFPDGIVPQTDCEGWDPAVWGNDPVAVLSTWDWGVGVGALNAETKADLEEAVVSQTDQATWDAEWEGYVVGGGMHWSALLGEGGSAGGYGDDGYTIGLAIDSEGALVLEGEDPVSLQASDISDGTMPRGAYIVRGWGGFLAEYLLPPAE